MTNLISPNKTKTSAAVLVDTLTKLGVDSVFGYPGAAVLSIYNELSKTKSIQHYLVRHEQAAVHAAEGYARVSGKTGVVLVTSGPGASNTVSGIANAYLDGYPLIILTGQVFAPLIGKDAFQEVNIIDITRTCTKANYQVTNVNELEETLIKAYECAMSGKQGPVVVDMAKNIFTETCEYKFSANSQIERKTICTNDDIKKVLYEISNAQKPVIVAGGGIVQAEAWKELYTLVKVLNIPVVSTMMALGTYPQEDDNYIGMIGIFGQASANQTLRESDLIFSIGARFNDRITCCFPNRELNRKFIQLDINPQEISRTIQTYMPLIGDAKQIINIMIEELKSGNYPCQKQEWLNRSIQLKNKNPLPKKISDKLHSFEVIKKIYEYSKNMDPIVTTEVGQHQLWTAQNFKFSHPRQFITSGGSGTMGFGFPAAIGASIALNKKPVLCISGDGSIQMNEQELATCVDYNLPVKIFILNNGYLGMVRQLQQKGCEGRYSETKISNPDFLKLGEAYGINGIRVNCIEEIEPALKKAFNENAPFIIDFVIEPMEVV